MGVVNGRICRPGGLFRWIRELNGSIICTDYLTRAMSHWRVFYPALFDPHYSHSEDRECKEGHMLIHQKDGVDDVDEVYSKGGESLIHH